MQNVFADDRWCRTPESQSSTRRDAYSRILDSWFIQRTWEAAAPRLLSGPVSRVPKIWFDGLSAAQMAFALESHCWRSKTCWVENPPLTAWGLTKRSIMIGLLDWWDLVWTIGESQQWLQAENDITPLFFVFVLMFLIEVVGGYVLWMMDVRCNLDHHGEVRHLHTMCQRSSMQLLSAVRHLTEGRTVLSRAS